MAFNPNFSVRETPVLISAVSGVASGKTRVQNPGPHPVYYGNQDKNGFRVIKGYDTVVITDIADVYIWAGVFNSCNAETAP